jgi:hypothetical protein
LHQQHGQTNNRARSGRVGVSRSPGDHKRSAGTDLIYSRGPKIAWPTRTVVAPYAMANSKSFDMPMESSS